LRGSSKDSRNDNSYSGTSAVLSTARTIGQIARETLAVTAIIPFAGV
jgi:hypothetical protein